MNRPARLLFALLCLVVLFEGFDVALAAIVLPYVGSEFGADAGRAGRALALVAGGAIAAFFSIRLADRFGRRPLLLASCAGFALFSLATAFSRTLAEFAVLQFCARVLLVTQVTVAYVLLSEVLPAERRGRANGLLGAFGSIGGALPALLLGTFLAHGLGWRGLFGCGALPLLLVPLLWRHVPESGPFLAHRGQEPGIRAGLATQLRALFSPLLARRFLGIAGLWFIINFASGASMSFFTWYVLRERGWQAHDLQLLAPLGLAVSFGGYLLAGQAMDRIGRRATAGLYLVSAVLVASVCYRAQSHLLIGSCYVLLQALQGIWPVAYLYTSELFPTRLRAAANGLANNLLGRWGQALAPAAIGWLALGLGSTGAAVARLVLAGLLAIPLLVWLLPETRGIDLSRDLP